MPTPAPSPGKKSTTAAPKMPAGTRVPWRPMRFAPVAAETTAQMAAPDGAVRPSEKDAASVKTAAVSMTYGIAGAVVGYIIAGTIGAAVGGVGGLVLGARSDDSSKAPKPSPDCYEGLTPAQRTLAEFILTAPPGMQVPGRDWAISSDMLLMAADEAEGEDGFSKLAACLRERAYALKLQGY
ncbi:MAG: hypothetical protein HOV80_22055 [Polyangiaceae bacterium]|nr:hypothetical protein [Polyangiaceae bacterium]